MKSFLRSLIFHNLGLKVFSLLLATMGFALLRYQRVYEYPRVAKLRILTSPQHVVMGPEMRTVDVTVRGPSSLFSQPPSERDLMGSLDLSREKIGRIRSRLTRENFPLLHKGYALTIHDSVIETDLDVKVTKTLPVRAVIQGDTPPPFRLLRILFEPPFVDVVGARKEVQKIDNIATVPIDLSNLKNTQIMTVQLAVDEFLSLRPKTDKVQVQLIVNQGNTKEHGASAGN